MRRYEWAVSKAAKNVKKHGVTFEDAAMACNDPLALTAADRIERGELRWRTVGFADRLLLFVAHTVEECGNIEVWRIISARKATGKERRDYENG
ncbi:MAG: BrnT family toxin [Candidatus Accumulibacter sp.]|jgi:uncharacterized DUF497 family protein|nr:BrnT family toxin [Accumulibacter sp.]